MSVPEEIESEEQEAESSGVDALFAAISKSKATTYKVISKLMCVVLWKRWKVPELIQSDKVLLEVLQGDVGQITKNDIKMANTSGADVIGFNVKLENGVMVKRGIWVFRFSKITLSTKLSIWLMMLRPIFLKPKRLKRKLVVRKYAKSFVSAKGVRLPVPWLWKDPSEETKGLDWFVVVKYWPKVKLIPLRDLRMMLLK